MVTLKDVAREAQVSIATVSSVLNKSRPVSQETARRVLEAAERLNYRPNRVARSLRSKRTNSIAYIIPSVTNPFFSGLMEGIHENAWTHGYSVILCDTEADEQVTRKYAEMLVETQVDGAIMTLPTKCGRIVADVFQDSGIPVVCLHGPNLTGLDAVLADEIQGAADLTHHLVQMGHRRIAFLGVKASTTHRLREEGFRKALAENHLVADEELVMHCPGHDETNGYAYAKLLVKRNRDFSAMICCNDLLALGALRAIEDEKLSVPSDVAVAGFDDTVSSLTKPRLTTVRLQKKEMSTLATQLLIEKIRKKRKRTETESITLPEVVIKRDSTNWIVTSSEMIRRNAL